MSTGPLEATFAQRAQLLHDAQGAAQLLVDIWASVDAALRGVIGPLGVAALLARSLRLTARHHPALAVACVHASMAPDLATLQASLAREPLPEALAASLALLQSFEELLAGLIGSALAERLLRPVWQHTPGDAPNTPTPPP
jgi:hypothetical protein